MFKKILATCILVGGFSMISSAFADTTVTWKEPVTYDQQKFEAWYAEPANQKLWTEWYTTYHTEPEFATFCKQTWAGTYCK
ncbi:Uncharacterised protein [Legionella wadsworthii]|uniref:Uncharacterized protein n=1 Tax=Legionella wadsworthii TaxID=28088 RepID=A0A378LSD6_9GAMM|nr:hypothetical protein [Legionella wadsworthii]STY28752.1 Uncharacterised protein [Legionella wadsworthii]